MPRLAEAYLPYHIGGEAAAADQLQVTALRAEQLHPAAVYVQHLEQLIQDRFNQLLRFV